MIDIRRGLMVLTSVMHEVLEERGRQVDKGYTSDSDDDKQPFNWYEDIDSYNSWARLMLSMDSPDKARKRFVQIAALAVAAVESIDRKASSSTL